MTHPSQFSPAAPRLFAAIVATFALALGAFAAEEATKNFDVPAGDAIATLKQVAQQGGVEIMFPAATVQGVKTSAVKGGLTVRAALDRMLAGTGLVVVQDEKTGALAVKRDQVPNVESRPDKGQAAKMEKTDTGALKLAKLTVLGTRIRQTEAQGPSPVSSYSAEMIAATGALTLSDFLATVPQTYGGISVGRNSSPSDLNLTYGQRNEGLTALVPNPGGSPTAVTPGQTGVSGVSLRSLGSGSTLVLVDGKRMAQSPSGNRNSQSGQGFVDLNLIPLGLIDHVELITDGASAIYGADAVAGVINIVLKKNYTGAELSSSYKATQHGGGNEQQSTLTLGFSGLQGRLHGMVAVNYYQRDTLMASQRDFSSNPDHSAIIKGYNATTGAPIYGYDLRIQYGYPATLQAVGGTVTGKFNALPGVSVVVTPAGSATTPALAAFIPKTTIPVGQTTLTAQGQQTTNEAPYIQLVPWAERYGALGSVSYAFKNGIEVSAAGGISDSRGLASTMLQYITAATANTVPAALNPFNQNVLVGMVLPGFGALSQKTHTQDINGTFSLRGKVGQTWQWNADLRWDRQTLHQINRNFNASVMTADLASGAFNPFIDATAAGAPDQSALFESMALYPTIDATSGLKSAELFANGDLFEIWGGPIKMAIGSSAEQYTNTNTAISYSAALVPVATTTLYTTTQNKEAVYGELSVPVFGKPNATPLLRRLDLNVAGRYEQQNNGVESKAVPKYGFSWAPFVSLLFRGSYSEGWRAPSPTENRAASSVTPTSVADPSRGGLVSTVNVIRGPNPALQPETSTTKFVGAVYEPVFVKGLSLNVNYYSTEQENAIISVSTTTLLANEKLFPGHTVRAAQTAADIAANQPGALISVDSFFENFGVVRNDSVDFGADYVLPWQKLGRWRLSANASHTLKASRQLTPGQAAINDVGDTYGGPKWKTSAAIYWSRGSWTASGIYSYLSGFNSNLADVNALAWNQTVPSVQKVDLLCGYRFANGVWRGHGRNVQVSLGVNNVFDQAPPFSDTIYSFDPALHGEYIFGRTFVFSVKLPL